MKLNFFSSVLKYCTKYLYFIIKDSENCLTITMNFNCTFKLSEEISKKILTRILILATKILTIKKN